MTPVASKVFAPLMRQHITDLALDLSRKLDSSIEVEFDSTDDGQEWAALTHDLDPLTTFVAGAGTNGGHIILDATSRRCVGSAKGTLDAERLVRAARRTAEASFRSLARYDH